MERLLQYLSTNRNYGIRYYASNMQLQVQSDASYLCRPRARSISGGLFYLGIGKAINGSIACTSKMISCIVASAAEAELAAEAEATTEYVDGPRISSTTDIVTH